MWGDVAVLCAAIFSIHLMFLNVFFTVWLELNDRSTFDLSARTLHIFTPRRV